MLKILWRIAPGAARSKAQTKALISCQAGLLANRHCYLMIGLATMREMRFGVPNCVLNTRPMIQLDDR